jgi:hypothetical protein
VEETLDNPRSLGSIPKDTWMLIYKSCCMTRKQRRQHPSIIKPATSIYIDEEEQQQFNQQLTTLEEQRPKESSSEFYVRSKSEDEEEDDGADDQPSDGDGSDYYMQQEWEEAEKDVLDSMEFIVSATMVASKNDRRSFVKALHKGNVVDQEHDIHQPQRNSIASFQKADPEETPLLSNVDHKHDSYMSTARISNANKNKNGIPPPPPLPFPRPTRTRSTSVMTDISVSNRTFSNNSPFVEIWTQNYNTRQYLMSYWLYSFANVAQSEAFPLFAMASTGLQMEESSIGLVGTLSGLVYCIGQYFIFSLMMKHLSLTQCLRYGSLWYVTVANRVSHVCEATTAILE